MQVTTTPEPATFAAWARDWLAEKPVDNNVLLLHALDPAGLPPGEEDPVFATVRDAGGDLVGAAFVRRPYRMTISEMPAEASHALAEHLAPDHSWLPGVNGPAETARAFAERFSAVTGAPAQRERDQWLMRCDHTERPADAPGAPRLGTDADLSLVADWFAATMRDSGMGPDEIRERSRHMVEGQLAGERLVVWESEAGEPAGAAGWAPPLAGVVRPSGVFVAPEHRDGGYATLLLGEVTARALDEGADACVCTHYLAYESMLAVVEKVGYRRVRDLTEYRFG